MSQQVLSTKSDRELAYDAIKALVQYGAGRPMPTTRLRTQMGLCVEDQERLRNVLGQVAIRLPDLLRKHTASGHGRGFLWQTSDVPGGPADSLQMGDLDFLSSVPLRPVTVQRSPQYAPAVPNRPRPYSPPPPPYRPDIDLPAADDDDRPAAEAPRPAPAGPPPADGLLAAEVARLAEHSKKLNALLADAVTSFDRQMEQLREENKALKSKVEALGPKTLTVKRPDLPDYRTSETVHPQFDRVMQLASARRNVLLVGPAGCGKSHLASSVADALGMKFDSLSCSAGMGEGHLLGKSTPNVTTGKAVYQKSAFVERYEKGGVFLLDEIDAADGNLLLAINTALANGYLNIPNRPDKPTAERHKDFVLIATANTFGRGASRLYAGRNQLDEATLDRFRIGTVECEYSSEIEALVCPDVEGLVPTTRFEAPKDEEGERLKENCRRVCSLYGLRGACQFVRHGIEKNQLRRVMSTRFLQDAAVMVRHGWEPWMCLEVFFGGWTREEVAKVLKF